MLKSRIHIILIIALLLSGAIQLSAQTVPSKADEGKLIAVIKSSDVTHKEKVDACRGLALIATEKSIAPLVALLSDEKLSHMARYALEPIKDPAVDEAFRDALGKLKGNPLVGVIGSVGGRHRGRWAISVIPQPQKRLAMSWAMLRVRKSCMYVKACSVVPRRPSLKAATSRLSIFTINYASWTTHTRFGAGPCAGRFWPAAVRAQR